MWTTIAVGLIGVGIGVALMYVGIMIAFARGFNW